ncbi:hypothetical protein Rhe02_81450 [Rhizocola hellebori]|uniref:Uncharacterized protein n=1 Tax=Rhizocola hellebori TaxID=1392758 RepID=A0A8J3VLE8_9ACTN|nr:hypothetical protein Rhe02_81450 [Rhizocola hellebori]
MFADEGYWSHVICMPCVDKDQVDEFIDLLMHPWDTAAPPSHHLPCRLVCSRFAGRPREMPACANRFTRTLYGGWPRPLPWPRGHPRLLFVRTGTRRTGTTPVRAAPGSVAHLRPRHRANPPRSDNAVTTT